LKSSLLITDYSNVFFDFGYLKKPVIYTHFDYNEYRNNHFQKGYFDYEKNGFGPICKDIQCTIKEIIFSIKKHCLLGKKYIKRINKFFKYSDGKNNERIFEEIINVENRKIENRKNSVNFLLIFTSLVFFYKFIKII
jgi:CDP-glycerol glycerophosphotransferase (TagB/SpsB family)